MEVEFRGFELQTPLGGIAVGRGYSRVAGEDYFQGLAVELPVGRFRVGWRVWGEADEESSRRAREEQKALFGRHAVTYLWVVTTVFFFNLSIDRGNWFVVWVAGIWGAVLSVHFMQVFVLACLDARLRRKRGAA